ncbi:MAG TPA: hypothetical protein VKY45_02830, partial [Marinilabiliaceae bacterium]|nr:hypothetical protein [Marinilabiliaceae bacterium]
PELFLRLNDVVGKYLNECADLPDERRKALEAIIKLPPQRTSFELTDGMVIADFYVPYLCCSDCPPIAYILPPPPVTDDQTPILRIAKESFCNSDQNEFAITALPAGGNLESDGLARRADGTYVFVPTRVAPGSHTIKYTLNQKSASVTVQVTATPTAKFTTNNSIDGRVMKVKVVNESTDTNEQTTTYEWLLNDEFHSDKRDIDPLTIKLDQLPVKVSLVAKNGACPGRYDELIQLQTVSKEISVCSHIEKWILEPNLPAGSATILLNEGEIMTNDLIILPASMNITETTVFKVSYAIDNKKTDVTIKVIFANADFSMEIKRTEGDNNPETILYLKALGTNLRKTEWHIKKGGEEIINSESEFKVNIVDTDFGRGRVFEIALLVEVDTEPIGCENRNTFRLTKEVTDRKANQGPFNNDFTLE